MSIKFVSGNIFTYPGLDSFCHGCNCKGVMGAGIAAEVRRKFPLMHSVYRRRCKEELFNLGDVFTAIQTDDPTSPYTQELVRSGFKAVYNLATQYNPGACARLDAINESLTEAVADAVFNGIKNIGVPRLGAGIGGLKWEDVKRVITTIGASTRVELIVFETFAA